MNDVPGENTTTSSTTSKKNRTRSFVFKHRIFKIGERFGCNALVDKKGTNKEATILIGAKGFRTSRTKLQKEGDMWRDTRHQQVDNTIDLQKIATFVEMILNKASIQKKNIEIELVQMIAKCS